MKTQTAREIFWMIFRGFVRAIGVAFGLIVIAIGTVRVDPTKGWPVVAPIVVVFVGLGMVVVSIVPWHKKQRHKPAFKA